MTNLILLLPRPSPSRVVDRQMAVTVQQADLLTHRCLPHAVSCVGLDFPEAKAQRFVLKEMEEAEGPSAQALRSPCPGMTKQLRSSQ